MNWKHKNVKFTLETKDLINFSFFYVKITRKNKRFVTSPFRKTTFNGVLLITIALFLIPIRLV